VFDICMLGCSKIERDLVLEIVTVENLTTGILEFDPKIELVTNFDGVAFS
jgi:hypothetical protein